MGRRYAPGGRVYHVMNRVNERTSIFEDAADYAALLRILREAVSRVGMRVIAYSLMPNHWHLLLWPREDGDLARFMHWLTMTHAKRWRQDTATVGAGHLYRGRYKSIPVESDSYYLRLCRYVERNALRANLVSRAEDWPWSSLPERQLCVPGDRLVSEGPLPLPQNWIEIVNEPETEAEFEALRDAINRGIPYGSDAWVVRVAKELGLEQRLVPRRARR